MSILKSIPRLMAIASQIFGSTLLAQTPEPAPLTEPQSTPVAIA
jgi:hypothetical protein